MASTFPLFDFGSRRSRHEEIEEAESTIVDSMPSTSTTVSETKTVLEDTTELQEPGKDTTLDVKSDTHKPNKLSPLELVKDWKSSFMISSITNTSLVRQRFFYTIRLLKNDQLTGCGSLSSKIFYSSGYTLEPRQTIDFNKKMIIWLDQTLSLQYNELKDYQVCLDAWQVQSFTFNNIFATIRITLYDLLESGFETKWILKSGDVDMQRINVQFSLERIFHYNLVFHDWSFIPSSNMPKVLSEAPKSLRVGLWHDNRKKADALIASAGNFWPGPQFFMFQGTLNELRNSFIEIILLINSRTKWHTYYTQMGKTYLSLHTLIDHPHLSSTIKKLTFNRLKFLQGTISGYLDPFVLGESFYGILDKNYSTSNILHNNITDALTLCILLVQIEGLEESAEFRVKTTWDGMVNYSSTTFSAGGQTSFNENLIFPVKLIDKRELINPRMINEILPMDLHSRGNITFRLSQIGQAYFNEEDYIGEAFLQLRKLKLDEEDPENTLKTFRIPLVGTPYSSNPTLVVKAGFVPSLPKTFRFIHEPEIEYLPRIYAASAKRWKRDFDKFQQIYQSWFPEAIKDRDFSPLDSITGLPLSSLITPLKLPIKFSPIKLLHWASMYPQDDYSQEQKPNTKGFSRISPISRIMTRKKVSGPGDRALLIAGVLLAQRQDVYIAKGSILIDKSTIKPHYWAITVHGPDICFWDPATPRHWSKDGPIMIRGRATTAPTPQIVIPTKQAPVAQSSPVINYSPETIYTMRANFDPLDRTVPDAFFHIRRESASTPTLDPINTKSVGSITDIIREYSMQMPFSPQMRFAQDASAMRLPHLSVEVVFNTNQVWGNLQNHNPLLISYDFDNPEHWRPFLKDKAPLLVPELIIGPPESSIQVERIQKQIYNHIRLLIQNCLSKKSTPIIHVQLDGFTDLLEDGLERGFLNFDCNPDNNTYQWWLQRREEFDKFFANTEQGRIRIAIPLHTKHSSLNEVSALFLSPNGTMANALKHVPGEASIGLFVKVYSLVGGINSIWTVVIISIPQSQQQTTST